MATALAALWWGSLTTLGAVVVPLLTAVPSVFHELAHSKLLHDAASGTAAAAAAAASAAAGSSIASGAAASSRSKMAGMSRALHALRPAPVHALVDGNRLPRDLPCPAEALVKGDAREPAIMAASILAKVARDQYMRDLDHRHPGYGFAVHKGYPTPEHLQALHRLGPCDQHRRSFAPVRALLAPLLPG